MTIKRAILSALVLLAVLPLAANKSGNTSRFIPEVHGVFRGFYEYSTTTGQSKFDIHNARLSAGGNVLPMVDYFLQVDFCQRGKINLLDAYVKLSPAPGLKLFFGQMRVPFSAESSRVPHLYHFAHVGLVAELGNLRSVGIKAGYTLPKFPLYIEGGIFNGSDRSNHLTWNSQLTYSIKANIKAGGFKPEIAFMSRVPGGQDDGVRFNQGNASLSWSNEHFFVEGEYIYRAYTNDTDPVHAYDFFVDYGFDVNWKWARRLSFQGRIDGITYSTSTIDRTRFTAGTTAHYSYKSMFLDFRINYEHAILYNYEGPIPASAGSKLIGGLILYF